MKNLRYIFTVIALFLSVVVWGEKYPKPLKGRMVHDFAKVLSASEEKAIEKQLLKLNDSTTTQITVVTVSSLNGETPAEYATELGQEWGVGDKDKDNGIVVLFKPKVGKSPGQIFIAVGYGLEGAVPDATAKMIIEREMIPYFRQGKIGVGISHGVKVLTSLVKGEYSAKKYTQKSKRRGFISPTTLLILIFIIVPLFIPRKHRKSNFSNNGASTSDSILPWILISMMSNRGGGGFGGGGGSGFGGGGFGGFGGGGFGGGGSGGSW